MYTPKMFELTEESEMLQIMQAQPFAALVSDGRDGLNAEHLPFITSSHNGKVVLQAHIAKANPLPENLQNNQPVLVLFQAGDTYVSPNWYPSKQLDGKVVPTWNYTSVHAKGRIRFIHEPQWILGLLNKLTNHHEKALSEKEAWSVLDAPEPFIQRQLKAIVGIEIIVDELLGKSKVSQNKSSEDQAGVKAGLIEHGLPLMVADSE